jgi:hypothetical protein
MEWKNINEELPKNEKVLAVYISKKSVMYNMRHDGWFRDTVYACRYQACQFIIESHGPILPATHWMEIPALPLNNHL